MAKALTILLITIIGGVAVAVLISEFGPPQPVIVTNPVIGILDNHEKSAPQMAQSGEYIQAKEASRVVLNLLKQIEADGVQRSEEEEQIISNQFISSLNIVEAYYRQTKDCEFGRVLHLSLSAIKANMTNENKIAAFNQLITNIENNCDYISTK